MITVTNAKNDTLAAISGEFADLGAEILDGRLASPANVERCRYTVSDNHVRTAGPEWYGGLRSLADAVALAANGWPEGVTRAAKVAPELAAVVPPPQNVRRRVRWSEQGTELHVDRALAGDWDIAWRSTARTARAVPRVISIGSHWGGNCYVTAEEMFWSGAQMLVATDLLEAAGYAVEVHALEFFSSSVASEQQAGLIDITVKQADQPARLDTMAAMFAHAGIYRTFGFALCSALPWLLDSHYGKTRDLTTGMQRAKKAGFAPSVDLLFPEARNIATAKKNISAAIAALENANNGDNSNV